MEQYYAKQASLPHFSGHYRQRGGGFGALAAGIGRAAIPFARRVILPAAKKLGKELLMSAAPELIDVAMKKKSPKQALKNTVKNTHPPRSQCKLAILLLFLHDSELWANVLW